MIPLAKAAAFAALLLPLAACQVTVDNKTKAQLDNAGGQVDAGLDKAGHTIGKAADQIGNAVEHGADKIDHGVNAHVKIHVDKDDHATGNKG